MWVWMSTIGGGLAGGMVRERLEVLIEIGEE